MKAITRTASKVIINRAVAKELLNEIDFNTLEKIIEVLEEKQKKVARKLKPPVQPYFPGDKTSESIAKQINRRLEEYHRTARDEK